MEGRNGYFVLIVNNSMFSPSNGEKKGYTVKLTLTVYNFVVTSTVQITQII